MPSSARCTSSRAGRPAAAIRGTGQCDDHPDALCTIRHGTAVTGIAEGDSVPEGKAKSEQAPIRRPPSRAEGHCTGARLAPFSFGPCTARFLFGQDRKGAPAALRAVGRGGARERAQFSPQAETELSGLCDDAMGGASRWTSPLAGARPPRPPDGGPPINPAARNLHISMLFRDFLLKNIQN